MISWLFEIDALKLSTKDVTYSAVDYSGIIISDSFNGVSLRWNISGNGLIAPNDLQFDVSNVDDTYTASDFETKDCTVRLIIDDVETRTWKFTITRALVYYGKITCYCEDFLQQLLVGDYPNTKSPKNIWPSDDADNDIDDDYCVPVILGTAYIPVRSVNTATERYYILGVSGPTYTVTTVKSPRSWPNSSTWAASSYTMTGSVSAGYQLLQPIIADSTGDGNADATGLWRSGDTFYDMLCKYSRDDTVALTNPAEWIEYVLEDFGVASADLDAVSFAAADAVYDSYSIVFNGGWFRKQTREAVLSNLLAQCDSFLVCTDKVELYQFSKTSKETITNLLSASFSPSPIEPQIYDSGKVAWPSSATVPQDVLDGKADVPIVDAGPTVSTSSETLACTFLVAQSQNAQKAGVLYFHKKYGQTQRLNFSTTLTSMTTATTISPGQVITINNTLYGGSTEVIITDMQINPDLRVEFTGVAL